MAKKIDKVQICLFLDKDTLERFDNVKKAFPWRMSRTDSLLLLLEFYENNCLQAVTSQNAATTNKRH